MWKSAAQKRAVHLYVRPSVRSFVLCQADKTRNISLRRSSVPAVVRFDVHATDCAIRMLRKIHETATVSDKRETSSVSQTCPFEKRARFRRDNGNAPEQQSALVFTDVLEIPSAIITRRFARKKEKEEAGGGKGRKKEPRELAREPRRSRLRCRTGWKFDSAPGNIASNLTISSEHG